MRRRLVGQLFAATAALIGLLSLTESLLGVDLRTDRLLFHNLAADFGGAHSLRLPPTSALGFAFIGCALLLLDRRTRRGRCPTEVLAFVGILDGVFGILDYVLHPAVSSTGIAVNTSVLFVFLGCALLTVRPEHRIRLLLTSPGLAATAIRHLMPAAVVLPMLVGWLAWRGESGGLYAGDVGIALTVVMSVGVLALIVFWKAEHLLEAEGEIRKLNEELEQRVIDRTAQLEAANTQLRGEIIERKRAEEGALRAKQEWERTFDAVPDLIAILDDRYRILRANRAMAQRLGVSTEECVGKTCYKVVHGLECPPAFCPHAHTLADGQGHLTEVCEGHLGGSFMVSTTPLVDEQGKPVGSVHVARDITERKRAEEALRASEERFRVLSEAMPQLVWSADAMGLLDYCNQRTYEYSGVRPADIQGWNWASIVHPEDRETLLAAWRRSLATGEIFVNEQRIRRADGQLRWHLTRGVPVRNEKGEVIRWIGSATDIDDQKMAEQESERRVAERTAELAKSMALLETVTSNAPVILFATDAEGVFTVHTGKAIPATERQPGEIIGKRYQEVLSNNPPAQDYFRRVLSGEAFTAVVEVPNGNAFETLYRPLRDGDGKITGMIGLSIDITERKRAEETVKRAQQAVGAERQRFNDILNDLPAYVVLLSPDYHVPFANRFFRERFGESNGKRCYEYLFGRSEPCEICETFTVLKTHAPHRWEWTGPDGRNYDISDFPFTDTDGSTLILEMGIDITDRKRAEVELHRVNRALRTLSECNQTMVRARDESELLQEICRILVEEGGYRLAWVGFAEQDEAKTVRPVAHSAVEEGYVENLKITWADTDRGRGPTGTAIRTGQPTVCRNMLEDPRFGPWREEAARRGYASSCALPIILGSEPIGALAVYSPAPDAFDTAETRLLTELALDIAFGLQALRTRAERERAMEALQRASAYNRSLIEASLDPLVTISPEGKITDVNRATENITGLSREELIGTDFSDYFTNPHKARAGYEKVFREGWVQDYELRVQHRDGHVTPVLYNASVYRDQAGRVIGVFAAARDIIERKRMEEELRQLSGRLLQAQDEERRRIARDLHDSTSQNLAAVGLNLSVIEKSVEMGEAAQKCVAESISLTQLCLDEIRSISYLLHPPFLDEMGLTSALEYYVDGFSRRSGIQVSLAISPDLGRLPKDVERTLFRVVQEGLMNILRHAGSPTAKIGIGRDSHGVVLEVQDQGRGIPTPSVGSAEAAPAMPGVGIAGMRERLRLLGGQLEIRSGPQGTTIHATVPLPGENYEAA
ncbi:MAG: PAS domain S-box protein [Acidobacteriia bacterium]|nr:PAS domain S-box protein [Terriglobia bacterium]